jgi:hypothetical protein
MYTGGCYSDVAVRSGLTVHVCVNLEKMGFLKKILRVIWVPQSFFDGKLGSEKLFEVILGSATSKRLKNTILPYLKNTSRKA